MSPNDRKLSVKGSIAAAAAIFAVQNNSGTEIMAISQDASGGHGRFDLANSSGTSQVFLSGDTGVEDNYILGNLGIGTSSPGTDLEVASSGATVLTLNGGVGGSALASIIWENNSSGEWELQHEPGTGRFELYDYFDGSVATYVVPGGIDWTSTSDARLKSNIKDIGSVLDKVSRIKVRTFNWKDTGKSDNGFIAQELMEVIPEAVEGDPSLSVEEQAMGVTKSALIPYLTKAIQELKAELDSLKLELKTFTNDNCLTPF
jgi:hypothetical protein